MSPQLNFNDEKLETIEKFCFHYSGPSFETGIKIKTLIRNLKSIEELIYAISDVNLENKLGYNKGDNVKEIKVIPKSGSLIEEIIISFSNPEVRGLIGGTLVSLFFYLLEKNDQKSAEEKLDSLSTRLDLIEGLLAKEQKRNIIKLYEPLESNKDSFKIVINNETKFELNYSQKNTVDSSLEKIERDMQIVESEEVLEGYISVVNIDTKKLKFHAKGMPSSYPLLFDSPIKDLLPLIATPILAKMKIRQFKKKIISFHLLEYKLTQSSLNEFKN